MGTFGDTGGRLAIQGDVWRYTGTFGNTGGRLAIQGDVWRYRGTFGDTGLNLYLGYKLNKLPLSSTLILGPPYQSTGNVNPNTYMQHTSKYLTQPKNRSHITTHTYRCNIVKSVHSTHHSQFLRAIALAE